MKYMLYKAFDAVLTVVAEYITPLIWGMGIGLLFGSAFTIHSQTRAIKQDCDVMGVFRMGEIAYACQPWNKK